MVYELKEEIWNLLKGQGTVFKINVVVPFRVAVFFIFFFLTLYLKRFLMARMMGLIILMAGWWIFESVPVAFWIQPFQDIGWLYGCFILSLHMGVECSYYHADATNSNIDHS